MADQLLGSSTGLQTEGYASVSTHKRKREGSDLGDNGRTMRSQNTNGESIHSTDHLQQQLLQAISQSNGVSDDENARTAQAALATPMPDSTYPPPDQSYDSAPHGLSFGVDHNQSPSSGMMGSTAHALYAAREASTPTNASKPAVGTPQWHQQRKDNHKEVERRRRETINDGINEIAKIVPGAEKNKGSILHSAAVYITDLVNAERKWQNEKGTLDAAVKELSYRFETIKESQERAWAESSKWQKRCHDAGLQFDDYDEQPLGGPNERDTLHAD